MTIYALTKAAATRWVRVDGLDDETGERISPYDFRLIEGANSKRDGRHYVFEYRGCAA